MARAVSLSSPLSRGPLSFRSDCHRHLRKFPKHHFAKGNSASFKDIKAETIHLNMAQRLASSSKDHDKKASLCDSSFADDKDCDTLVDALRIFAHRSKAASWFLGHKLREKQNDATKLVIRCQAVSSFSKRIFEGLGTVSPLRIPNLNCNTLLLDVDHSAHFVSRMVIETL